MRKDFSFDQMRHTPGFALSGLFVLASLYTLYFARAILLPVVLALLLSWSLAPIVHALKTLRLPGAARSRRVSGSQGELLTSVILGKYFTLNPIVVFLSILVWGWLWGAVGALIAVPILVSFWIFSANIPALRPICDLISVGPERKA